MVKRALKEFDVSLQLFVVSGTGQTACFEELVQHFQDNIVHYPNVCLEGKPTPLQLQIHNSEGIIQFFLLQFSSHAMQKFFKELKIPTPMEDLFIKCIGSARVCCDFYWIPEIQLFFNSHNISLGRSSCEGNNRTCRKCSTQHCQILVVFSEIRSPMKLGSKGHLYYTA